VHARHAFVAAVPKDNLVRKIKGATYRDSAKEKRREGGFEQLNKRNNPLLKVAIYLRDER